MKPARLFVGKEGGGERKGRENEGQGTRERGKKGGKEGSLLTFILNGSCVFVIKRNVRSALVLSTPFC